MDWQSKKDILYTIVLIGLSPLAGFIVKDSSHTVEKSLEVGDKKWLWMEMMGIVFCIAMISGWLIPFTWLRLGISIVAWPILGYLMMLGALKSKSKLSWSFRKK
jgi:hypothetical protein